MSAPIGGSSCCAEAVATEQQRIVEQIGDMCTYRERDGRALPHPHPSDHLGPCPYGQVVWHILAEQRAEAETAAPPVDSQSLAEVGDRVPVMAVLTVGGRWVACMVTDAGVTGGFRTWRGVPEDADLRRSEVHSIWSDVPPWSPAIGLLRFPDELAGGA